MKHQRQKQLQSLKTLLRLKVKANRRKKSSHTNLHMFHFLTSRAHSSILRIPLRRSTTPWTPHTLLLLHMLKPSTRHLSTPTELLPIVQMQLTPVTIPLCHMHCLYMNPPIPTDHIPHIMILPMNLHMVPHLLRPLHILNLSTTTHLAKTWKPQHHHHSHKLAV